MVADKTGAYNSMQEHGTDELLLKQESEKEAAPEAPRSAPSRFLQSESSQTVASHREP